MGTLDNITIFRFAHIFRNPFAGGVEAYLYDLNYRLLERNKMRILQMYLAPEGKETGIDIQAMGQGELVWIPSFLKAGTDSWPRRMHQLWARLRKPLVPFSLVCHDVLLSTLRNHEVNLAIFHWISKDSRTVLRYLSNKKIPFLVVNHFHNERFNLRIARKYLLQARGIAGVSNVGVTRRLKRKFVNLSDGIDTEFFQAEKAGPLQRKIERPLILLPSRITEGKGHLDAVQALSRLARRGLSVTLAFAGRIESTALLNSLRGLIKKEGVEENVIFLGEIKVEEMRDWYGASDIVLLASYSEGLARVILEAQAMEKPVVAYNVGGISEAIKENQSGYLVRKGDIEGMVTSLEKLLEHEEKRLAMGGQGRKYVLSQFSIEQMVARHEAFYSNTIKNFRP